jgi:hypothetical protein
LQNSYHLFSSAQLIKINSRDYKIKYSYQVGKDIFNNAVADEFFLKSSTAFDEANSAMIWENEFTDLAAEDVDYNDPTPGAGLVTYIRECIDPAFDITILDKSSRLIAVKDITNYPEPNPGQVTLGITFSHYDNELTSYLGYSFLRVDPHNNDKKLLAGTAIHELGHLRGQGSAFLFNFAHTDHNGVRKAKKCVMWNFADLTPAEKAFLIDNPLFCAHHVQIFLNLYDK